MNEKLKELAAQAGYFLYDLTETHGIKTVESALRDEWVTLDNFYELVRQDEQARCIKIIENISDYDANVDDYYSDVYVKAIKGELRESE